MKCKIIVYHNVRYDILSQNIAYLYNEKYNIVGIDELAAWLYGDIKVLSGYENILFTFDDRPSRHLDLLKFELPLRKKFICYIWFDWNDPKEWVCLRQLHAAGIQIGAHTVNHKDLVKLTPDEIKYEMDYPKQIFKEKLGVDVRHMATPYGHNNPLVTRAAGLGHYLTVRAVQPGCVTIKTFPLDLPSYSAYQDILIDEYKNTDIALDEFRAFIQCQNGQFYDKWCREALKKRGYIK